MPGYSKPNLTPEQKQMLNAISKMDFLTEPCNISDALSHESEYHPFMIRLVQMLRAAVLIEADPLHLTLHMIVDAFKVGAQFHTDKLQCAELDKLYKKESN